MARRPVARWASARSSAATMTAWLLTAALLAYAPKPVRTADPRVAAYTRSIIAADALEARQAGVQVVYPRETTHLDVASIAAKAQLVQRLHTELGFDTLAIESDAVSCLLAAREVGAALQALRAWDYGRRPAPPSIGSRAETMPHRPSASGLTCRGSRNSPSCLRFDHPRPSARPSRRRPRKSSPKRARRTTRSAPYGRRYLRCRFPRHVRRLPQRR